MIEFGNSLRAAREAKGYSIRQLSEITRMAPATLQDLEAENFSRIVAPIYGRGFVKLYCGAVGLDPQPFINEFMDIYTGNRQADIKERPLPSTEAPPPSGLPESSIPNMEPDLFLSTSKPDEITAQEPPLSRYASPIRQTHPLVDLQLLLRLGALALAALLLTGLLLWGIRAIYRATRTESTNTSARTVSMPAEPTSEKKPSRTPQKIPSLYLD